MRGRRGGAYRQLPAWSPLGTGALLAPAAQALRLRPDPRPSLRRRLIERYDATHVRLCASGTHALQLGLESVAASRPGGIILLPAYTCYEVATAAVGARVRVALYDIDARTLAPDADSMRRAARGHDVSAIVVAPLYGMPVDWSAAREIAQELGGLLIEDAAQGQGSTFDGRPVGSFGDLSVLSFGRGKGWTGMGGGALLWRAAGTVAGEHAADAALLPPTPGADARTSVAAAAQWLLGRPELYGIPASIPALKLGETIYHAPTPLREMSRASAALVLATDRRSVEEAAARREVAAEYSACATLEGVKDPRAGVLRAPLLVRGGWDAVRGTDAAVLGAGPPYPGTLARLAPLQPYVVNPGAPCPGADRVVRELVTLPTHSRTRAAERSALASVLSSEARS